jgi:hypothetical protein
MATPINWDAMRGFERGLLYVPPSAAIMKDLVLGGGRLGKGFPPYPFPKTYLAVGMRSFEYAPAPSCLMTDDDQAGLVPLKAKSVPVVEHKPFPDVLGFTDHPMAPLVEWPK